MFTLKWSPLFIALAAGQTFPGFVPETSNPLVIEYTVNSSTPEFVSPDGKLMDMTVVASPPTIGIPLTFNLTDSPNGFLFIMVDTDVLLPNATNITTILHHMRGNLTLPQITSPTPDISLPPVISLNFTELIFPVSEPALATYLSPSPLPDQKHRYTFLLFNQTANFTTDCSSPSWNCIPSDFQQFLPLDGRLGFNVSLFAEETGIGVPVAGFFMEVESAPNAPIPTTNGTQLNVPNSTATGTSTGSGTTSSTGTSGTSATASATSASDGTALESVNGLMFALGLLGIFWVL